MQYITRPSISECTGDYYELILFSKDPVNDIMMHSNIRRDIYASKGIRHSYTTSGVHFPLQICPNLNEYKYHIYAEFQYGDLVDEPKRLTQEQ